MGEFEKRPNGRFAAIYALLAVAAFAFYLIKPNSAAFLTDDSPSYIYFNPGRPIGYPLFIAGVKALTGSYRWLPQIQLAVALGAMLALALAVRRLLGSAVAGGVVLTLSAANVAAVSLAFSLMSDIASLAALAFFAAAVIHFLIDGGLVGSTSKSLLAAVAMTIRPVNVTLLAADLIAIAGASGATARRKLLYGIIALALAAVGVMASPFAHHFLFGAGNSGSPLARGLFQKAIYVEPIDVAKYRDCIGDRAYEAARSVRDYVRQAPEPTRRHLAQALSDTIRFQFIIPLVANERKLASGMQTDPYLTCYAAQAAREHPAQLLGGAWIEFWASETNQPFLDPSALAQLKDYLAAHPAPLSELAPQPPPPDDLAETARTQADFGYAAPPATTEADIVPARVRSPLIGWPLRLFGMLAFAAPFVAAILLALAPAPLIRRSLWAVVALSAISMTGRAVSAVVEFALTRYTAVYWPIDVAVVTIFIFAIASWRGAKALPPNQAPGRTIMPDRPGSATNPEPRESVAAPTLRAGGP